MKRRMKIVLPVLLVIISLTGGWIQQVYAEEQSVVREAESGDVEDVEGKGKVDVSGEIEKTPSSEGSTISSTDTTVTTGSSYTTSIGKPNDTTGKGIRTGDIPGMAKTLAVLMLGIGCLFLLLRRKKEIPKGKGHDVVDAKQE